MSSINVFFFKKRCKLPTGFGNLIRGFSPAGYSYLNGNWMWSLEYILLWKGRLLDFVWCVFISPMWASRASHVTETRNILSSQQGSLWFFIYSQREKSPLYTSLKIHCSVRVISGSFGSKACAKRREKLWGEKNITYRSHTGRDEVRQK